MKQTKNNFHYSLIKHKTMPLPYLQGKNVCKTTAAQFYLLMALIEHEIMQLSYVRF